MTGSLTRWFFVVARDPRANDVAAISLDNNVTDARPARRASASAQRSTAPVTALVVLAAAIAAPPSRGQMVGAPEVPGGQRPVILTTPNGLPLVNIQTPSAAGVSRNVYRQFNVGPEGAVLNNSRGNTQTQLGGWVQGNPNLAGGAARIVLNEVNGGDPSCLRGYLEVGGQRAEVIIANPAGISVDGGGFINASRATLTTGTPQFNAIGGLDGFLVRGGTIAIDGKGLDLSRTDYAAILARAVQANAGIWASELKVVTGANRISADHARADALAGDGAAPVYALDVAALGGMYAGKIVLIGTEAGLGVRNAGTVQAASANVAGASLASAGQLVVTSAGRLENLGTLQGTTDANLSATALANSGRVSSGGNLKIVTQGDLSNAGAGKGGTIEGSRLELNSASGDLDNRGGTLRQTSGAGLALHAPKLGNAGGVIGQEPIAQEPGTGTPGGGPGTPGTGPGTPGGGIPGGGTPGGETGGGIVVPPYVPTSPGAIAAAGAVRNEGGKIYLGGAIELNSADLDNTGGSLSVARMNIVQPRFDNRGGTLNVSEVFNARVEQFDNRGGKLSAGRLDIAASGDLLNQDGTLGSGGDANLDIGGLDNARGTISAVGALNLSARGAVNNNAGTLAANREVAIAAQTLDNDKGGIQSAQAGARLDIGGALTNSQGQISAAGDLNLIARELSNSGHLRAGNDANVTVAGGLNNDGAVTAARHLTVQAGNVRSGSAGVLGAGIQADGKLGTAGDLRVTANGALIARGNQLAAGDLTLDGASVDLSEGQTSAAQIAITARSGDVVASKGTVAASGQLRIDADGGDAQSLINQGGRLHAGQLELRAGSIRNTGGGEIVQTGTGAAIIGARNALSNDGGRIASNGADLSLSGATIGNAGGKIEHAGTGTLNIAGGRFDGDNGQITGNGALAVDVAGAFNHNGGKISARQVAIAANSLANRGGQIVHSGNSEARIQIAGALDNNAGIIAANGHARIQAGSLANQGGSLRAAENADLTIDVAQGLDNRGNGEIVAGRNVRVRAGDIVNDGGRITAVADLDIGARDAISNLGGTIAANGATSLEADRLDNSGGNIAAVRGPLNVVTAGSTRNDGGSLQAGGRVTLSNSGLSNAGGKVFGDSLSVDTRGQALNNSGKGILAATNSVELSSGALNNDAGLIQSGKALRIDTHGAALSNTNSAGAANGQGGISSGETLSLNSGALNNSAGFIGAKQALAANTGAIVNGNGGVVLGEGSVSIDTHGALYDNRGGKTQAKGDLSLRAGAIDNTGALIRSLATATLDAGSVVNASTQGAEQGIEARDVAIASADVNNTAGAIRADANASITSGGRVDNSGGLISAGDTVAILDPNRANPGAKTLELINGNGTVVADKNLRIDAAGFSGDGRVLSNKDLSIALSRDVTQTGEVAANGNLSYVSNGTLTNRGKLMAGQTLTVGAGAIDNTAGGEIVGGTTVVNAGHVTNRGLIDGRNTQLNVGALDNIGTGRIYGDAVSIAADTINNGAESIGGTIKAGTIAARGSLDIAARSIDNREQALIFSGGDMTIGGALDAERRAVGRGGVLNNLSAQIESLGDMAIGMGQINNLDVHLRLGAPAQSTAPPLIMIAPVGASRMYRPDEVIYAPGSPNVYLRNPDGSAGEELSTEGYGIWTTMYAVTEDTSTDAAPSRIVSGGDMLLDGDVLNRSSRIIAGGALTTSGLLDNRGLEGTRTTRPTFIVINHRGEITGSGALPESNETIELNKYRTEQNLNAAQGYNAGVAGSVNVDAGTGGAGGVNGGGAQAIFEVPAQVGGVIGASGATAGAAQGANGAGGTDGTSTVPMVVRTRNPDTSVPRASLFGLRPDSASRYLIETDPRFTDQRRWLSSDYLLDKLGFDGNQVQKRLGDGFYEQKLIREQIAQLTGFRYLDGFGSDETQYTALMNAGASFAAQYGLRPGVALSAAQMAQLTSDIVWLVEQTVALPGGGSQRVLVPQVYVRVRPGDIDGSGALLSGNTTRIESAGDLVNTSTIAGRKLLTINAENVNNLGGRIDGGSVSINARNDLNNLGGSIVARDAAILTAGNDINIRTTTRAATGPLAGVNIDRVAGVYVSDPGGVLLASAGRDLNLAGAVLANVGEGGRTLASAGRDVNVGTVVKSYSVVATGRDGDTKANGMGAGMSEVGSQIFGAGSVAISAGRDVNARAANVAASGVLAVSAENDINIDAGVRADSALTVQSSSSRKGLMRSRADQLDGSSTTQALGSAFSGRDVAMSAGNDLKIRGSDVLGERQVALSAGRDVRIESAQNTSQTANYASSKTSGVSRGIAEGINYSSNKASGFGIGSDTRQVASTIAGGNVSIDAGRDARVVASNILGDRNVAIAAGRNIDILAAQDTTATMSASDRNNLSRNLKPGAAPSQTLYSRTRKGEDGSGISSKAAVSMISAANGSVSLNAGLDPKYRGSGQGNVTSEGATLVATDRISIVGNAVNLMAATSTELSKTHKASSGHTVGAELAGTVGGKITGLYKAAEKTRKATDERMQAALALKAGYDAYKFAGSDIAGKVAGGKDAETVFKDIAAGSENAAMANAPDGAAFGVSFNESRTRSREDVAKASTSQRGTQVQAGRIDITARDSDITIEGGKLQARDIVLDAKRDVNLLAAKNTAATLGNSSGSSLGGGATVGFGSQNGVSVQLSIGGQQGKSTGFEVIHDNTLVTASNSLSVKSGRDTNLRGAQLAGESVKLDVGRDLNIETLQDITRYSSDNSSRGLDLSLCIPPICYGQYVSATAKYSSETVNHGYLSANGQSGISAGKGGYDINVRGNTDLIGGAITSTAAPDKNSLTTASLSSRDLKNQQTSNSSSSSLSVTVSSGSNAYVQGPSLGSQAVSNATSNLRSALTGNNGLPPDSKQEGHTLSVISPGSIKITGTGNAEIDGRSAENVATLTVRDPKTANGKLENTLTLQQAAELPKRQQEAKARQDLADMVGGVVTTAIGDISASLNKDAVKKEQQRADAAGEAPKPVTAWTDGSPEKVLLHGLAGAIQARIGNGDVLTGLAAGAITERLTPVVAEFLKSQGLKEDSSEYKDLLKAGLTMLGAAVGAASGDPRLGANLAEIAVTNNYLKHAEVSQKNREIAACRDYAPCIKEREEYWNQVSIERNRQIDMSCTMQAPEQCRANLNEMRADLLELKQYASGKGINPYTSEEWTNLRQVEGLYQANLERLAAIGANRMGVTTVSPATLQANGYLTQEEAASLSQSRLGNFGEFLGVLTPGRRSGKTPREEVSDAAPPKTSVVRVDGQEFQLVERSGGVLRQNPVTKVYEPVAELPAPVATPGLPVPSPTPPPLGLPAPNGYVILPIRDSSGTSIPVVMASDKFSWAPTDPNNLIGSQNRDHERSAERFIRATETVVGMFDARVGNDNGFDPSYIKKTADGGYQLVLVEDKSGAVGKLTAFGQGHRGEAQMTTNLQRMRDKILADRDIPDLAKIMALDQIDRRTFQVQLFVGPTSNPTKAQLDDLRNATGGTSSVVNVVVLPRAPEAVRPQRR